MIENFADDARRYRLDSPIATGGMGEVWRGMDTELNRPVAIKLLKPEFAHDTVFRTRFESEARAAGTIHHPGVAAVYDVGESLSRSADGTPAPWLVMELVEGQPLSALLTPGRALEPEAVRALLIQVGDALGAAHAAGVVHRDVKPANLLVTPDRTVKVTDFGIARAASAAAITGTGQVMGTPQYLSPEQARGERTTPASDVYALGVVGFECLTGSRPFQGETPVLTALAHLREPVPELPPTVPADLAGIVRKALSKKPSDRYADGAAFAAALRAGEVPLPVVEEPATQVIAPTPGATPERSSGLSWWIPIVLLMVLIAVVIGIAVIAGGGDGQPDPVNPSEPTTSITPSESDSEVESPTIDETTSEAPTSPDTSAPTTPATTAPTTPAPPTTSAPTTPTTAPPTTTSPGTPTESDTSGATSPGSDTTTTDTSTEGAAGRGVPSLSTNVKEGP